MKKEEKKCSDKEKVKRDGEKDCTAAECSEKAMYHIPAASFTDHTGYVPVIPETSFEAHSYEQVMNDTVTHGSPRRRSAKKQNKDQ